MFVPIVKRRTASPGRRRDALRPVLELLEGRCLLSGPSWPGLLNPVWAVEPDDTLPLAVNQNLGNLNDPLTHSLSRAEVVGDIGLGVSSAADVDWFQFSLTSASTVTLRTLNKAAGSPLVSVLSLYGLNIDPIDMGSDPFSQFGFRLLAQDDGASHDGDASLTRNLAPGTYYLAVSGSGNRSFHPYVPDSGLDGSTGAYGLLLTASSLGLDASDGPVVLAHDPVPGSQTDHSPLVLRVSFSAALDPSTIDASSSPTQTIHLYYWPPGQFGIGPGTEMPFAAFASVPPFGPSYFTQVGNELQLLPGQRLPPGTYQLVLQGNQSFHLAVLKDLTGLPLGWSAANPNGRDFTATFQITGVEGDTAASAQADDTRATAHDLGDITNAGLVQAAGTIGDDPWYDFNSPDPQGIQNNPSNDVDLYRFTVSGPGNFVLTAETFAGRIGSPLLSQNTLYKVTTDAQGNPIYTLVSTNSGSLNATQYTFLDAWNNPQIVTPFANDPVLYAGLQAGEYLLAVSTFNNQPDLSQPSHSWQNGNLTLGDYVLNLRVELDAVSPQVTAVSVAEGDVLSGPLTRFTVQFNKFVYLPDNAVFVLGSDNQPYAARLMSYDASTHTASFLMLDGLPVGPSDLHLSGTNGVTDLFGTPLAGNPAGDYVVHFTVGGPVRGTGGAKPLVWNDEGPGNTTQATAQILGPLFPLELQTTLVDGSVVGGVTIQRDFSTNPASASDADDYYQFELLQSIRAYGFNLTNLNSNQVTLIDADGHVYTDIDTIPTFLGPGAYWLRVTGWPAGQASGTYSVQITLTQSSDNPPPLTAGAAPAIRVRLAPVPMTPTSSGSSPNTTPTTPPGPVNVVVQGTPVSNTTNTTNTTTAGANLPTASPKTDILPALLRLALGETGGSVGLPSGSLLGLSTGPLGGVRNEGSAGAMPTVTRLLLSGGSDQDLDELASSDLPPLLNGVNSAEIFIDWESLLQGYRRLLDLLWKGGVEDVPAGEEGDEEAPPAGQEALTDTILAAWRDGQATTVTDDVVVEDDGELASAATSSDATWCSLAAQRVGMFGFFTLGMLASVRGPSRGGRCQRRRLMILPP